MWLVPLLLLGCALQRPHPPHPPARSVYAREFERFWANFDRLYPYFEYKHVDWDAQYAAFRPWVNAVHDDRQFIALLTQMVAPLRDVHIKFKTPDGRLLPSYEPHTSPNWDTKVLEKYVSDRFYYEGEKWIFGQVRGIPYIMIPEWTGRAFSVQDFDATLEKFRDAPALILDVRMNGGGDDKLAYAVADRFAAQTRISEYVQFRDGPLHNDFTGLQPRYVRPSGPWQFTRPVALLIGPDSFSSNESFIAAMQTLPNVTTLGATTGGGSGDPEFFPLGDGWRYSVPRWIDYTADKQIIEWRGIAPEVPVATTPQDFQRGDDPVLDAALKRLQSQLQKMPSAPQPQ